ncbi:hypothetical protein [Thomasclavelia spiroformis]|uniref:hypothetical protein n=1 Tax=Thomasclavelia spiroformis TaxID=29348 RepID=UPI0039966403
MKLTLNILKTALCFEEIVTDIFRYYNYTIIESSDYYNHNTSVNSFDLLVESPENKKYAIEIKYSRNSLNHYPLAQIANRLIDTIEKSHIDATPILVIGAMLTQKSRHLVKNIRNDMIVLDIQNLLYIVDKNENIKNNLLSLLEYSTNDIIPEKPETSLFDITTLKSTTPEEIGLHLKEKIIHWSTTNNSYKGYENLCYETLHYLFSNELSLWKRQEPSNSELYRFDLICKIKDGDVSGLWATLLRHFNSKYIIFEFKNYTDKITQREIYTTDRYLYLKALRSVAIIISCKGASENAQKAIRGTLRENGKLILSIDNDDLLKMIDIKIKNEIPADYLYDLLDNLLIDLEK